MTDYIETIQKHLKVDQPRKRIGYDTLAMSPTDELGNTCLDVIVDLHSHHVQIYPRKTHQAEELARNLFSYYMTFGTYDQIITDPGSDIMGKAVTQLNAWLGLEHLVSVVGRHESNGVEGTNKQIIRHIRTLVHDERRSIQSGDTQKYTKPSNTMSTSAITQNQVQYRYKLVSEQMFSHI